MDPFEEERVEQRKHFLRCMGWVVFIFVVVPTLVALAIWRFLLQ